MKETPTALVSELDTVLSDFLAREREVANQLLAHGSSKQDVDYLQTVHFWKFALDVLGPVWVKQIRSFSEDHKEARF